MGTALAVIGPAIQGFSMIYKGQAEAKQASADYQSKLAYNKEQLAYRRAQGEIQSDQVLGESKAEAAGLLHSADSAQRAAKRGRIQADQIGAAYRVDLNTTVANIRAIRASTGASASSPSSIAYMDKQERASANARKIKVGGVLADAAQADTDALFYRASAEDALLRGKKTARSIRKASKMGDPTAGITDSSNAYSTAGFISSIPYFFQSGTKAFGY